MSLRILSSNVLRPAMQVSRKRYLSFSFAGPRNLEEILKKDLISGKSGSEVSDMWFAYHDSKVRNTIAGLDRPSTFLVRNTIAGLDRPSTFFI